VSYEVDSNCYQMQRAGDTFRPNTGYNRIKGIEFSSSSSGSFEPFAQETNHGTGSSDMRWDELLITCTDATLNGNYGCNLGGNSTMSITNSLIIANGKRGADFRGGVVTANHCGIISANTYGLMVDSAAIVNNTWAYSTHASKTEDWYSGVTVGTNNSSLDGTATTSTGEVTISAGASEFTSYTADPATADLTLKDSLLNEAGTGSEAVDITGSARTGTADIGPFNYAAASTDTAIIVPTGPWR